MSLRFVSLSVGYVDFWVGGGGGGGGSSLMQHYPYTVDTIFCGFRKN